VSNLIVVDNPKTWSLHIAGVPVVAARTYLTDPHYSELRNLKVFNLCRSYRYQSTGYYVSLLAMARGHRPLPSITTIQDMKSMAIARVVAEDLDDQVQYALRPIKSPTFTLSIYFGENLAKRYDDVSTRLFRLFQTPLLRAEFVHEEDEWRLGGIGPIAASEIPEAHQAFVVEAATRFFAQNRFPARVRDQSQYDLAILHNPEEPTPPSDARALQRFAQAARRYRLGVEFITREDFARLAEFDALFIRETTAVNHHTYRFARRALAEGLVVIDDPDSIAKCSNKVYLTELLARHNIPLPRTLIVHRENRNRVIHDIGVPCILKQPDSSFSQGVLKAENVHELEEQIERLLDKSDLVIAQEFVPTDYDWRIGVLNRQALFACRYYMVKKHWQIAQSDLNGTRYGETEAVPLEQVPHDVLNMAVRAARLIGDGLYGVDLKQIGSKVYVIEVNDNPNIDAGCEDRFLKSGLYEQIIRVFVARIQQKWNGAAGGRA